MREIRKDLNKLLNITIIIIVIMFVQLGNNNPMAIYTSTRTNPAIITSGSKDEKIIALSFDDGPHPKYTVEILDLLKEYDIKATFFVLGMHAESYPDIIKRQVSEGHEIGNHSYSHVDMRKASLKVIQNEYNITQDIIYNISNVRPKVFRPPYGNYNSEVVDIVTSDDSAVVLWTFYQDSKDWSNPGVDKIVDITLSKIQNGDIILFHDYVYKPESHTVKALETIIPKLISQGYEFVTISELIGTSQENKYTETYN